MPFATQLFATSSEAWFFVLLLDLRRSVRNPFYSFDSSKLLYRIGAWSAALATATVLVAWRGPTLYGVIAPPTKPSALGGSGAVHLDFASCWIRDATSWRSFDLHATDLPKWFLFYGPLLAVYAYAIFVLAIVRSRLSRGLSSTFAARVRVAAVSVLTVLTYLSYWLVYGALVVTITTLEHFATRARSAAQAKVIYDASSTLYAVWSYHKLTKCWWDLLVWLFANDPALFFGRWRAAPARRSRGWSLGSASTAAAPAPRSMAARFSVWLLGEAPPDDEEDLLCRGDRDRSASVASDRDDEREASLVSSAAARLLDDAAPRGADAAAPGVSVVPPAPSAGGGSPPARRRRPPKKPFSGRLYDARVESHHWFWGIPRILQKSRSAVKSNSFPTILGPFVLAP